MEAVLALNVDVNEPSDVTSLQESDDAAASPTGSFSSPDKHDDGNASFHDKTGGELLFNTTVTHK